MPAVHSHSDFDPADLAAIKAGIVVSVCIPARDEAATVGTIVERIRTDLMEDIALVDELVVVDDHSCDATAAVAEAAGATVVSAADTQPQICGPGKGQALWKSLHASKGDVIVWCDADLAQFSSHFITGLLGPLITDPAVQFVKATYHRPLVAADGGGRVTELMARPVLANLLPHLAGFGQPLAGEYGGRRSALEAVPFVDGYGVDIALLADIARLVGIEAMCEVDLGERHHRNRTLDDLGPQATEVLRAALSRSNLVGADGPVSVTDPVVLKRPGLDDLVVVQHELPPVAGHNVSDTL